ncbi:hypothetical protein CCACVL1_14905 [Corchorus capsularis]|uniref:DNA replication factor Cdt1 C-terminal domain-containing protein n=1 Tax=Corchorus capsularis TaxID=210143 RepID=A0A1R3I539_COCAP|nr:hypothetical protein CCACVL1_14905 [Corchorus capsularis]
MAVKPVDDDEDDVLSILPESLLHSRSFCKIITGHCDIVDRGEVEEQLKLFQELAPEWISEKLASAGDLPICDQFQIEEDVCGGEVGGSVQGPQNNDVTCPSRARGVKKKNNPAATSEKSTACVSNWYEMTQKCAFALCILHFFALCPSKADVKLRASH